MGNEMREKKPGISSSDRELTGGGCSGGVLHMIKYHHWRHFMKRVTHQKTRHLLGNRTKKPRDHDKTQEEGDAQMDRSNVEEKTMEPLPQKSSSVKARIKSLLSEEKYMRKGRHHRSSSCPVQPHLTRSDGFHSSEPADLYPHVETLELDYQSPKIIHENNVLLLSGNQQDSLPICRNGNYAECSKIVVGGRLVHDHVDEYQNVLERHDVDSFRSGPKEYLDAQDIISSNKELLVHLFQDPGSPLAHHFQNQQALSAKREFFAKSETFPSPGSSGRRVSGATRFKQMHEAEPGVEEMAGISHSTSLVSTEQQENQGETRVGSKSFEDFTRKIKDIIKESRKEMHRVAMDAVLHKIPHGKNMEEIDSKFRSSVTYGDDETEYCSVPSRKKNKLRLQQMRRASSLNDSLDSYCRLLEMSLNREAKHQTSEGLKMRAKDAGLFPKYLERIRSLPDLKYLLNQNDESTDAHSSGIPIKAAVDSDAGTESCYFDGQKSPEFSEGSEDHDSKIDVSMERTVQENSVDLGETNDVTADDVTLTSTEDIEKLSSQMDDYGGSTIEESETKPIPLAELANDPRKEMEEPNMETPEVSNIENVDLLNQHLISDISNLEVAAKDKAEFSYVKDVLELSGFSENSFLKTWHSDEQPVDPSVYEEVKGCLVLGPECCGNELEGKCDHILLFDLINEVLMEVYARSYSYCPFALSSLSRIRLMPSGPNVLREVWSLISWYLSLRPEVDQSLDHVVGNDMAKSDGWMNLQFDAECVGIELEDWIFDDLLEELIWD